MTKEVNAIHFQFKEAVGPARKERTSNIVEALKTNYAHSGKKCSGESSLAQHVNRHANNYCPPYGHRDYHSDNILGGNRGNRKSPKQD